MEWTVVPFKWEHILVIVPILNDGNIYGTMNVNFWDTLLQFFTKIFDTKKAPIRLIPLRRNITSWKTKRYALNSQRSQLFNASKISFQLALEAFIWINLCKRYFNNFPDPEKCLKRNGKRIFSKAVSNRVFSGTWKCFAISWRNIANWATKAHATERARTQLSDA